MKIKVDRTNMPEGALVFTVTVSEPRHACFGELEKNIMTLLDITKDDIARLTPEKSRSKEDAFTLMHHMKQKFFTRVLENLKHSIKDDFEDRLEHIYQEIYNWIYDAQTEALKTWMLEYDPQRTKYYFDNDVTVDKNTHPQESEYEEEDEIDDTEF